MGIRKGRVLKTGVQGKASEGLAIEVQMEVKSSVQSVQLGVKGSVQMGVKSSVQSVQSRVKGSLQLGVKSSVQSWLLK